MSAVQMVTLLMQALIAGLVWGLAFYFVRKGLNKSNFTGDAETDALKTASLKREAVFGALAAFVTVFAKHFVTSTITPIVMPVIVPLVRGY
jgi:hypothetical protein